MSGDLGQDDPTYAGQAVYTPFVLRAYGFVALQRNGRLAWRCPPSRTVGLYDENVSSPHLDIGVGTGYMLDKCRFPTSSPQITLLDLNPNSLASASRRIRRYSPSTHRGSALEPFGSPPGAPFGSIAVNWLLHCLPGDIASKSVIFDHCREVLAPGGVVFGGTVLNGGVRHTPWSRRLMDKYNRTGVFTNLDDDLDGLKRELTARFAEVDVHVVGTVGLFTGRD